MDKQLYIIAAEGASQVYEVTGYDLGHIEFTIDQLSITGSRSTGCLSGGLMNFQIGVGTLI